MEKPLFIISGPSGAGEDSVIEGLRSHFPIERVITTTSRAMREGEQNGEPYFFITDTEFRNRITDDEFVEYAEQYNGKLYGVTKGEIERVRNSGKIGIWKIEYKGVMQAKKQFEGIIAILIDAPIEVLEDRMRRRGGMTEEQIRERLEYTREWLRHRDIYDHSVTNVEGKLDETIEQVANIIRSELST
jgi:guanylate kinase